MAPAVLDYTVNKHVQNRNGNRMPNAAPHNAYLCKGDDSWCVIAVTSEEEWADFCKAIGREYPLCKMVGWRNDLKLDEFIESSGLRVREKYMLKKFDFWHLIFAVNEK